MALTSYSARSDDNARKAKEDLFSVQNARKAYDGELAGLLDPSLLAKKKSDEEALRSKIIARDDFKDVLGAWDRIAHAQNLIRENARLYNVIEAGHGFNSLLFHISRALLRAAEEKPKPNHERLREFGEAGLESLEFQLFSEEPIYDDFEQFKLANSLTWLVTQLGSKNEIVERVLAGKSPRERASELVAGTKVKDVALRKKLYKEGRPAVEAAKDPMIELARLVDTEARAVRKIIETQDEAKQQAHAQISKARFAVEGTSTYPDATFTLRLAYGALRGYDEGGKRIPFQTTFAGLYARAAAHHNKPPFDLPPL